jgi:hypothetical protein
MGVNDKFILAHVAGHAAFGHNEHTAVVVVPLRAPNGTMDVCVVAAGSGREEVARLVHAINNRVCDGGPAGSVPTRIETKAGHRRSFAPTLRLKGKECNLSVLRFANAAATAMLKHGLSVNIFPDQTPTHASICGGSPDRVVYAFFEPRTGGRSYVSIVAAAYDPRQASKLCDTIAADVFAGRLPPRLQPRKGGKLLFADDFIAARPGAAALFNNPAMSFERIGGVGRLTGINLGLKPVLSHRDQVRDFFAECRFRALTRDKRMAYGLLFRGTVDEEGLTSYYAVLIRPVAETVSVVRWHNQFHCPLMSAAVEPALVSRDDTHTLRVEVAGDETRVFLDRQFVLRVKDHNLPGPGLFGLHVWGADNSGQNTVEVQNLRLWRLPE